MIFLTLHYSLTLCFFCNFCIHSTSMAFSRKITGKAKIENTVYLCVRGSGVSEPSLKFLHLQTDTFSFKLFHYTRNIELSMFTNTMFEFHWGELLRRPPPPQHPHQYARVSGHCTVEEQISGLVV